MPRVPRIVNRTAEACMSWKSKCDIGPQIACPKIGNQNIAIIASPLPYHSFTKITKSLKSIVRNVLRVALLFGCVFIIELVGVMVLVCVMIPKRLRCSRFKFIQCLNKICTSEQVNKICTSEQVNKICTSEQVNDPWLL